MITTKRTTIFRNWFDGLKDVAGKRAIASRIVRMETGNFGDHKRFDGIIELRLTVGPGYRVYCLEQGSDIVILMCGGTKRRQSADIERARQLRNELWKE